MKTIKIAEATPLQIDYLVAMCEGWSHIDHTILATTWVERKNARGVMGPRPISDLRYSTNAAQGQPILEREGIATRKHSNNGQWFAMLSTDLGDSESAQWNKTKPGERYGPLSYQVHRIQCRFSGPTMLIAGLRCFLVSRLGETAEVPEGV